MNLVAFVPTLPVQKLRLWNLHMLARVLVTQSFSNPIETKDHEDLYFTTSQKKNQLAQASWTYDDQNDLVQRSQCFELRFVFIESFVVPFVLGHFDGDFRFRETVCLQIYQWRVMIQQPAILFMTIVFAVDFQPPC